MSKRILPVLFAAALLFCGCSRICSDTDAPAPPETGIVVEVPVGPAIDLHFCELSMEDFVFSGGSFTNEDGILTVYRGEITDPEICKALWEILCLQEQEAEYEGGTRSSNYPLILTHRETGEEILIGYGIWYENPENEGGPACFTISGEYSGTHCYAQYSDETAQRFRELIDSAVQKDEYITDQRAEASGAAYAPGTLVLANVYCNWAWGFQYYGEVIDLEGNVLRFDFSDDPDQSLSWEEAGLRLWEQYEVCALECIGRVDAETMEKCWELGVSVNPDAPMSEEHTAYDAGQWTLCLFEIETGGLIPLYSTGDYERRLQDEAAKEILALYRSMYE